MKHEFKTVISVKIVSTGILDLEFECGTRRTVDVTPVMSGALFGELRNSEMFNQVSVDDDVGTIFWPNGADFDPDTLFRWDEFVGELSNQLQSA